MSIIVKICGVSTPHILDVALDAGADLIGFVFFPPSPRNIDMSTARELGRRAAGRAGKVAVTVDADDGLLATLIEAVNPDMLQLHGRESPSRVTAMKSRFGLPVMKALPVANTADLAQVPTYATVADYLLFDARAPRAATRPGGLGKSFDWSLLSNLEARMPYMLSGGLHPGNVAAALAVTRATAVDVSSGVECAPGIKDADKIRAFVRRVRRAADARNQADAASFA
jgi:phosphoribosylanthranilate isomerase